jgi:hypothetical protein
LQLGKRLRELLRLDQLLSPAERAADLGTQRLGFVLGVRRANPCRNEKGKHDGTDGKHRIGNGIG